MTYSILYNNVTDIKNVFKRVMFLPNIGYLENDFEGST